MHLRGWSSRKCRDSFVRDRPGSFVRSQLRAEMLALCTLGCHLRGRKGLDSHEQTKTEAQHGRVQLRTYTRE